MKHSNQICSRCIMDTSDIKIKFDKNGLCDYCNNFEFNIKPNWKKLIKNEKLFYDLCDKIKSKGKNKDFDCIIGLSGGLDSSYAAYVAKEKMGLRPLLFHVDAGWNTDQAVGNIEKLVDGLGLDLYTEVSNWNEIKRMQVAFLRSGIPDQDLVQDAVFFSELYKFARKYSIKYIITGSNYSTECCREPEEWGGYLGIKKNLTIFGNNYKTKDGTCVRDFIHVNDVAEAHIKCIPFLKKNKKNYYAFNIGVGRGISILELVNQFEKSTGISILYKFGKRRKGDVAELWASCKKSNKYLNWMAKYNLEEMILSAWNREKNGNI